MAEYTGLMKRVNWSTP